MTMLKATRMVSQAAGGTRELTQRQNAGGVFSEALRDVPVKVTAGLVSAPGNRQAEQTERTPSQHSLRGQFCPLLSKKKLLIFGLNIVNDRISTNLVGREFQRFTSY